LKLTYLASTLLAALLAGAPSVHAGKPASTSEMDALVNSLVQQAADRMNLPAGVASTEPETMVRHTRFVTSTRGRTLASTLGLRSEKAPTATTTSAFHKLLELKGRRGEVVRKKRRAAYEEALQELMVEHGRALLVPHEDVTELSRLTGHRPSGIRRDLFRVTLPPTK
jgi:hypothetical protein